MTAPYPLPGCTCNRCAVARGRYLGPQLDAVVRQLRRSRGTRPAVYWEWRGEGEWRYRLLVNAGDDW